MSSDVAVALDGVSKRYRIRQAAEREETLVAAGAARFRQRGMQTNDFWALEDVSFELGVGEVLGIVGRNGAGKSTLLKVLSRITAPTGGTLDIYGRVGSLLEVGTGFHPELTGRENIYLNGSILGMRQKEIRAHFDEIVDFAGVEAFLDTPVKRYSSGMYVRLAFAVAAHLDADTLLVDEVLAVGDADFQAKCLGKMRDVSQGGRTVIFVSHQLSSVRALCSRALLLERGRLKADGDVADVIDAYLATYAVEGEQNVAGRGGSGTLRATSVRPGREVYDVTDPKEIAFSLPASAEEGQPYFVSAHVVDARENVIAQLDSRLAGWWGRPDEPQAGVLRFTAPWLKPGRYRVDFHVCSRTDGLLDEWPGACTLTVGPLLPYPGVASDDATAYGLVLPDFEVLDHP